MNILTLKKQLFFIDRESAVVNLDAYYEQISDTLQAKYQRFMKSLSGEDEQIYRRQIDYCTGEWNEENLDYEFDDGLYDTHQARIKEIEVYLTQEEKEAFANFIEADGWANSDPSFEDGCNAASEAYTITVNWEISKENQIKIWLGELEQLEVK